MKISKDKALKKINELLKDSDTLWMDQNFHEERFDQMFFGTLSILRIIYGEKSESTKQML